MKTNRGRHELLDQKKDRIIEAIREGNYYVVAAAYAGIGESTLYNWLARGRDQKTGPYREFLEAVEKAQAEAEVHAVRCVKRHMDENWQAAMTYLERRHPDRWRRREGRDVEVRNLTDDELVRRATGLLAGDGAAGSDDSLPEPRPESLP